MNKYSVRGSAVYVAVDELPAVHFATAHNEADAQAIKEAMKARELWQFVEADRRMLETLTDTERRALEDLRDAEGRALSEALGVE